jgi:hypothetical protein
MKTSRLFAIGALAASFTWLLAGGCTSNDAALGNGGGTAGKAGSFNVPDAAVVDADAAGPGGGTTSTLHPLCGLGTCYPDSAKTCRDYEPPGAGGQGGAGGEGATSSGGESGSPAGGQSGASSGGAGEGGASGQAGAEAGGNAGANQGGAGHGGESGGGGEGGQSGPETPSLYGCQVTRQNNEPQRQCERAGSGAENAPCFSAADCAAGLACVTEGTAGRCLRYCCSSQTDCGAKTYCAERQLRMSSSGEPTPVPVCVPADGCSLDEKYPCSDCRCPEPTVCMLVRSDTTTCLKPGTGQQGDACPCAWNHLCSSVTNQCVKICHTDPSQSECGSQKCQASAELPPTFGVCVGPLE